jgi:hypothetical protein
MPIRVETEGQLIAFYGHNSEAVLLCLFAPKLGIYRGFFRFNNGDRFAISSEQNVVAKLARGFFGGDEPGRATASDW